MVTLLLWNNTFLLQLRWRNPLFPSPVFALYPIAVVTLTLWLFPFRYSHAVVTLLLWNNTFLLQLRWRNPFFPNPVFCPLPYCRGCPNFVAISLPLFYCCGTTTTCYSGGGERKATCRTIERRGECLSAGTVYYAYCKMSIY